MLNYDPDAKANCSAEMTQLAMDLGLQVANLICDEPDAKVGDHTGVSFAAMVPFPPRAGDYITLEDGRICEVKRIHFKVVSHRDANGKLVSILLVPNVRAIHVKN